MSTCKRKPLNLGVVLLLGIALICWACGYHVRGSIGRLPSGAQSLGVPTFRNLTNQYRIEQLISSAVIKEFSLRTRVPVNSSSSGVDCVLLGEIKNVSSVPVAFSTQQGQTLASAFLVTVQISIKLKRLKDDAIIWQNQDFQYRERYALNASVQDFFSEENPALQRLAQNFAASLVSTILEQSKP